MNQATGRIDITTLIDTSPISKLQIRVVALCSFVTFIDGYDIQSLGLAIPLMAREHDIAPTAYAGALSASLAGIAIGALLLGPVADRWGRRPMLIAMIMLIGISMAGAAISPDPLWLTGCRLLTGLGVGGAVPTAVAMTAEYIPARRRAAIVTLVIAWMAFGSFAAGFTAPLLDQLGGWRAIFALGAVLSLLAALSFWFVLPESLRILVRKGQRHELVRRQAIAISPTSDGLEIVNVVQPEIVAAPVAALFGPVYRRRTLLLWTIFWCSLFTAYSLIGWLPTLLVSAGWAQHAAQQATGLLAIAGIVGGLSISWLADRGYSIAALTIAYASAAVLLPFFALGAMNQTIWTVLLLFVGQGIFGGQMALSSIAAAFYYPPELCSTGVGWYNGISRTGGIVGPLIVAALISRGLASGVILGLLTVPMLVCVVGVLLLPGALRKPARPAQLGRN